MIPLFVLLLGLMAAAPQADDNPNAEPTVIQTEPAADTKASAEDPEEAEDEAAPKQDEVAPKQEEKAADQPEEQETPEALRARRLQEMLKLRQARGTQIQPRQPIRRPTRRQLESSPSQIPSVTQRPQPGSVPPDFLQPPEDYQTAQPAQPATEPEETPEQQSESAAAFYPPLDPVQRSLMEVDLLQQQLVNHPDDGGAQVRLGLAYVRLGRPQEAIAAFEQALQHQGADPGLLVNLGSAQLQQGDFAAARKSLEAALAIDPHYASALFNLGAAAEQQKKVDLAIGYYKEAMRYDPKLGDLSSNPALVRSQLARVAQLQLYLDTRSAPSLTVPAAIPLVVTAPAPAAPEEGEAAKPEPPKPAPQTQASPPQEPQPPPP